MRFIAPAVLVLALAVPATAAAQSTNAPPGNSGLSQYLEVVPTARGNTPSKKVQKKPAPAPHITPAASAPSTSAPAAAPVSKKLKKQRSELDASGKDGQQLSKLAADGTTPDEKTAALLNRTEVKSASVAGTIAGSDASGGMGLWMPIVMVVLAVIAIATGWRRRSRNESS